MQIFLKQDVQLERKSGLRGSSLPTSHQGVFTGACQETDFMNLHDKRQLCKLSALQPEPFTPGMENKRKRERKVPFSMHLIQRALRS